MSAADKQLDTYERTAMTQGRNLVYGVGKTGLSIARFLQRTGANALFVDSREQPPGLEELATIIRRGPGADVVLGSTSPELLEQVSRVIVSPGISDQDPLLVAARAADIEVVSDIELFVENATAPFVAITGSNGKSTVTTLLSLMCRAAGKTALAGANLGEPALDLLTADVPDVYILELSSFQLQRTRHLPAKVAVLLNISPDHLDWHRDEADYRNAKYRVYRDAEFAVWNRAEPDTRNWIRDDQTRLSFGLNAPREGEYGIVVADGDSFLARGDTLLLACAELALTGVHNRANALAAMAAGELLGLDPAAMIGVLREFSGLPHRMQFVADVDGVRYIDDSKATNVGAAVASVNSVATPVVLIAGGQGKGGDFGALADAVHERLRAVVLIGEDAGAIERAFAGRVAVSRADGMAGAVREAARLAQAGDTVLLAPACASFDQFANYMQRGAAFCDAVEALGT
jgi:UDP-N-acetylmuramoylalanine--D-glutamate ligase